MATQTEKTQAENKPNDMTNIVAQFTRSLGNGVLAASHLATITQASVTSCNTNYLLKAAQSADKKGDKAALAVIGFVVRTIWSGDVEHKKDGKTVKQSVQGKCTKNSKTGEIKIKTAGVPVDQEALKRLGEAVKKGYSIRAATFRKHVQGETEKTVPLMVRDKKKWAENIVKAIPGDKDTAKKKELSSMIAALQGALQDIGKPAAK